MTAVLALSEHVTRNIWGTVAALGACLAVWVFVSLLFSWDDPDKARRNENREAMRELTGGLFDDRSSRQTGKDRQP